MEFTPWPEGTLTLCVDPSGLAARTSCRDHVFRVSSAIPVDYGCGWAQPARCLVCEYVTPPLDASWWARKVTEVEITACVRSLEAEIGRLSQVQSMLVSLGHGESPVTLRNFG